MVEQVLPTPYTSFQGGRRDAFEFQKLLDDRNRQRSYDPYQLAILQGQARQTTTAADSADLSYRGAQELYRPTIDSESARLKAEQTKNLIYGGYNQSVLDEAARIRDLENDPNRKNVRYRTELTPGVLPEVFINSLYNPVGTLPDNNTPAPTDVPLYAAPNNTPASTAAPANFELRPDIFGTNVQVTPRSSKYTDLQSDRITSANTGLRTDIFGSNPVSSLSLYDYTGVQPNESAPNSNPFDFIAMQASTTDPNAPPKLPNFELGQKTFETPPKEKQNPYDFIGLQANSASPDINLSGYTPSTGLSDAYKPGPNYNFDAASTKENLIRNSLQAIVDRTGLTPEQVQYTFESDKLTGVPIGYHLAKLYLESNFDRMAVSPKGAQGIAQLMPATAAGLSKNLGRPIDPYNVDDALLAQRELNKEHLARINRGENVPEMLARLYQGGPKRERWGEENAAYYNQLKDKYQRLFGFSLE